MGVNPQLNLQMWGEDHVTIGMSDDTGVLVHSCTLGKLNHQMYTAWNTLSLQEYLYLVTVTFHYTILIQMSLSSCVLI
jgi:hypothetical protein